MRRTPACCPLVVVALVAASSAARDVTAAPPIRRDLSSYFALAMRTLAAKNLRLLSACNVGVDCGTPNASSACGTAGFENPFFADGSQLAVDRPTFSKPGGDVFQLFANQGGPFPNLTVRHPPIETFATPIVPGTCGSGCAPDYAAVERLCGFPEPFPPCHAGEDVTVQPNADCVGAPDAVPGNKRCDLAPGAYGDVEVHNLATLVLTGGTYDVCSFGTGKRAIVSADTPAVVDVADGGFFRVGDGTKLGAQCGDVTIFLRGSGPVTFGRNGSVTAKICAPRADFNLGDNNHLLGQFIGDTMSADRGNEGRCCEGCSCFDEFSPTTARAGDVITFDSKCDLKLVTAVKICGVAAPILTQTTNVLTARVPAVPPGACTVEAESTVGVFRGFASLAVTP